MQETSLRTLEEELGYQFRNKELLIEALTHPSHDNDKNYERLEFLGDAVIELFVSSFLFSHYPTVPEGELTRKRAVIVCTKGLALIADQLYLGEYLILGHGEEVNAGRSKASILENTLEALAGAIYVDGGHESAWRVLTALFARRCEDVMRSPSRAMDSKSQLQELIQGGLKQEIRYEVVRSEGPPHDPTFYVDLLIGGHRICGGRGSSKKEAEQQAATEALRNFEHYFEQDGRDDSI